MNKLEALIESCRAAESGRIDAMEWVPHADIRRILEAVREDMADAERMCANGSCKNRLCDTCPIGHHTATRRALEQT